MAKAELRGSWEIHFADQTEFLVDLDAIERTPGMMVWAKNPPALRTSGVFRITCAGLEGDAKFQAEVVLVQDHIICLQINQHEKAKRELRAMREAIHYLNPRAKQRYDEILDQQDLIASSTSEFRLSDLAGPDPWGEKTDVGEQGTAAPPTPTVARAPSAPPPSKPEAPASKAVTPAAKPEEPKQAAKPAEAETGKPEAAETTKPPTATKEPLPRGASKVAEPASVVRLGAGKLVEIQRIESLLSNPGYPAESSAVGVLLAARAGGKEVSIVLGDYKCHVANPGLIVSLTTPTKDGVLDVLVKAKALTKTERDDLLKKSGGDDQKATKMLLNKGSMAPARLASAYRDFVLNHAAGLASQRGTYTVDQMVDPSAFLAVSLERALKDILVHALRSSPPDLMRSFFDARRRSSFGLTGDPDRLAKLKLKPEHQRFVDNLASPKPFDDLVLQAPMSRDSLQQFVVALMALGFIREE